MSDEFQWVTESSNKEPENPYNKPDEPKYDTVGTTLVEEKLAQQAAQQVIKPKTFNTPEGKLTLTLEETQQYLSLPKEEQTNFLKNVLAQRKEAEQQKDNLWGTQEVTFETPVAQETIPTEQLKPEKEKKPKKEKSGKKLKLPIIIGSIFGVAILGVGGLSIYKHLTYKEAPLVAEQIDYANSGIAIYQELESRLNNYDAQSLDNLIGAKNGDSYLAQEWAYVNEVTVRQEFIKKVCSQVKFEFPKVNQKSTTGVEMPELEQITCPMNNGEIPIVEIPDYVTITNKMETDRDYIQNLFVQSGYKISDYDFTNEITNLFIEYYLSLDTIPTTKIEIETPIDLTSKTVISDAGLDKMLFGSDEFHAMLAKFSQCCLNFTGQQDNYVIKEVETLNPEYTTWLEKFLPEFEKDGGTYDTQTNKFSDTQPTEASTWYINENSKYVIKEGELVQPDYMIVTQEEVNEQIELDWVEETGIAYNWLGLYYLTNDYTGEGSTVTRYGDGTLDRPAGVGTSIITKVKGTDLKYHDVRVTLVGYWTGADAIDYIYQQSTSNRGFQANAALQFICYELQIENLEDAEFTFNSEMALTDNKGTVSMYSGVLYGFNNKDITIKPLESLYINDWAASLEINQKYVAWGKSFGIDHNLVYFNLLAGTGEIPPYSAYKQFTGLAE